MDFLKEAVGDYKSNIYIDTCGYNVDGSCSKLNPFSYRAKRDL